VLSHILCVETSLKDLNVVSAKINSFDGKSKEKIRPPGFLTLDLQLQDGLLQHMQ